MIEQNIRQQKQFRILLIGDNGLDIYQYGTIDRISPEAPVPVFVPTYQEHREGMAGNVFANLVALGCSVQIMCGEKSTKTRYIDSRSKQQVLRVDSDVKSNPIKTVKTEGFDAIVIADYDKGIVSYELIEQLIKTNVPVFVETKKQDLARMHGAFVKINEHEYNQRWSINDKLIVTLGNKGAMFKTGRDPRYETRFPTKSVEVVDVTGAGDTFLSALTYKYLATNDINAAIEFANRAASVTVQHFGCYAPTLGEIK